MSISRAVQAYVSVTRRVTLDRYAAEPILPSPLLYQMMCCMRQVDRLHIAFRGSCERRYRLLPDSPVVFCPVTGSYVTSWCPDPGAVVRVRAVNKFDKVVTKTSETPFSERRWRVVGFLGASGLVTRSADYGVYRKVKIVSDSETRILHVTRLVLCAPTEIDVLDLRRAMRRIAREESK